MSMVRYFRRAPGCGLLRMLMPQAVELVTTLACLLINRVLEFPAQSTMGTQAGVFPILLATRVRLARYLMTVDGFTSPFAGTSAVAPLYAGLVAIINSLLGKTVGFLNPTLYSLGRNGGGFRDIADGGSNASMATPGYTSGPGWDACTGWGSIDGTALLEALRAQGAHINNGE